jgi:hypothetical protein
MANTVVTSGHIVQITGLDADWLWTSLDPHFHHLGLISIQFNPSAANDIFAMRNIVVATGLFIMKVKCAGDTDQRIKYFYGAKLQPVLDISDCTLGTAGNCLVTLHFGNLN